MGHDLGVWLLRFLRNAVQKSLDDLEKLSRDPTCGVHLQGANLLALSFHMNQNLLKSCIYSCAPLLLNKLYNASRIDVMN